MCDLIWYRGNPKGKCWKCDSLKRRACQRVFSRSKERLCRNYNHINSSGILNPKTVHTGEVGFVASTERRAALFSLNIPTVSLPCTIWQHKGRSLEQEVNTSVLSDSFRGCVRAGSQVDIFVVFSRWEGTTLSQDSSTHLRSKIRQIKLGRTGSQSFFSMPVELYVIPDHDNKWKAVVRVMLFELNFHAPRESEV